MANTTSIEQISDLIGKIYDASLDKSLWDRFLKTIAPVYQSDRGTVILVDRQSPESSTALTLGFRDDLYDEFLERREEEDYFWLSCKDLPRGSVFVGSDFVPIEEMRSTSLYHELAKPLKVEYLVGGMIENSPDQLAVMTFLRPKWKENFDQESKQILQLLLPHIQKAFYINRQFAAAQQKGDAYQEILEHSPFGIVVLDDSRNSVFVNTRAEKIFLECDGITMRYGQIKLWDYSNQKKFDRHVHTALSTANQQGVDDGGILRIARPSGKIDYHLLICPVNQRSNDISLITNASCLIFIRDPAQPKAISPESIQILYNLTPAEARLCVALFETGSLLEALDRLELSRNTAKTHLAHIFEKIGISSQAQLLQELALALGFRSIGPVDL